MNKNTEKYIEKEILTYSNANLILEIARADFHASKGILNTRDAVSAQNAREYFNKLVDKIEEKDDRAFVTRFIKEWVRKEKEAVLKNFQETHKKVGEVSNEDLKEHLNNVEKEWETKRINDTRAEIERKASECGWNIDKLFIDDNEDVLDMTTPPSGIEQMMAVVGL